MLTYLFMMMLMTGVVTEHNQPQTAKMKQRHLIKIIGVG